MSNLPDLSLGPESFEIPGSIPGEVEQIYQIAKTFQQIATQAGATASQLNGASGDLQWSGNAADQFRSVLGELPGMLNQVSNSYSTASEALSSYALTLSDYRAQFASARSDLANVLEECERISSQIETAKASGQDTSYLDSRLGLLAEEVFDRALPTLVSLWQDAAAAALQTVSLLNTARSQGDMNTLLGGVGRVLGDVGGALDDAFDVVANIVGALVHDVENLGTSLVSLINDISEGNWSNVFNDLDHVMQDLQGILSALAPLLQIIPIVGEICDVVLLVAAAYIMVYAAATGAGWGTLLEDGVNLVASEGSVWVDDAGRVATNVAEDSIEDDAVSLFRSEASDSLESTERSISAEGGWATRFEQAGDDEGYANVEAKIDALSSRADDLKTQIELPDSAIKSLPEVQENIKAGVDELDVNPVLLNVHGINITMKEVDAADKGMSTGTSLYDLSRKPADGDNQLAVASNVASDVDALLRN